MLQWNPYYQQWEPVMLVIDEPAPLSPWDTFLQQFASHLGVVLAAGLGAAILDDLLN